LTSSARGTPWTVAYIVPSRVEIRYGSRAKVATANPDVRYTLVNGLRRLG
jgi:hypothetical protein